MIDPTTASLLGLCYYAPTTAAVYNPLSATALTALDTTNLKVSFTTTNLNGGSTSVLVKLRAGVYVLGPGGSMVNVINFGLTGTGAPAVSYAVASVVAGTAVPAFQGAVEAEFLVTGLTPLTAYTWNFAAWAISAGSNAYVIAGSDSGSINGNMHGVPGLMKVMVGPT